MKTNLLHRTLFLLLLLTVCLGGTRAGTWYVDPVNGSDNWTGSWMMPIIGTQYGPLRTLGRAVSLAQAGDLVVLLDGIYGGPENVEPQIFSILAQKGLFLYGFHGPDNCIIALDWTITLSGTLSGQGQPNGVETVFDGVTFTQTGSAAAINVMNTRAYFNNCIFDSFKSVTDYVIGSLQGLAHLIFTQCQFQNNQKTYIVLLPSEMISLDMDQCEFVGNTSQALIATAYCDAAVRNCSFQGNTGSMAPLIGVMLHYNRKAVVDNCTFKGNSSNQSFSAIQAYPDSRLGVVPTVRNCSIFGNSSAGPLFAIELKNGGSAKVDGCTIYDNRTISTAECIGIQSLGVDLTISNTRIECLDSMRSGGAFGISCSGYQQFSVENCKINHNHTGIRLQPSDNVARDPQTTIRNVEFVGNSMIGEQTIQGSAAIWIERMFHPFTLHNCEFKGNGNGVILNGTAGQKPFQIQNCLFVGNRGLTMRLESPAQSPITVNNCTAVNNGNFTMIYTIWNNSIIRGNGSLIGCTPQQIKLNYCCYPGVWSGPGTGNFSADPLFADEAKGDYHLKSRFGRYNPASGLWVIDTVHSPCIDAGDPSFSIGQEPYGSGGRINVGRCGGTPEASKSAICTGGADGAGGMLSDFNRDCQVNLTDLAVFASEWLHTTKVQQLPY